MSSCHILIFCLCIFSTHATDDTISLMTQDKLGNFESNNWSGYTCNFQQWTSCINTTTFTTTHPTCLQCNITKLPNQLQFTFPPGGIFPITEQFTIPSNTAVIGAANPNNPHNKSKQTFTLIYTLGSSYPEAIPCVAPIHFVKIHLKDQQQLQLAPATPSPIDKDF